MKEKKNRTKNSLNIGFAQLDLQREERTGFPEVIYGEGKTAEQLVLIFEKLYHNGNIVLATRVSAEKAEHVIKKVPDAKYESCGQTLLATKALEPLYPGYVCVVCAGTSDLPVAMEAYTTVTALGSRCELISDVGVAGLHRLIDKIDLIQNANVVIVIAGMEGALPSVIGGLISKPIIAVPTSVGYGTSFNGISALLGMLNSCASGISVVNIDNGYGAGYQAGLINKLVKNEES